MSLFYDLKERDELVLINPRSPLGPLRAVAAEDKRYSPGDSAYFKVYLYNTGSFGIESMTVNVNQWDVYKKDDPKLAAVLLDHYQPMKG